MFYIITYTVDPSALFDGFGKQYTRMGQAVLSLFVFMVDFILINEFIAIMCNHYDRTQEKYGKRWVNWKLVKLLRDQPVDTLRWLRIMPKKKQKNKKGSETGGIELRNPLTDGSSDSSDDDDSSEDGSEHQQEVNSKLAKLALNVRMVQQANATQADDMHKQFQQLREQVESANRRLADFQTAVLGQLKALAEQNTTN